MLYYIKMRKIPTMKTRYASLNFPVSHIVILYPLYERDVFVAKSLNCSAIFFASGNFVCRCASVGSVVDQKYPHTHGRR